MQPRALVTGAGGFIGFHLTNYLKLLGWWVRGVDIKYPQYAAHTSDEFLITDLRTNLGCIKATEGINYIFGLAADMGGMGFISSNHSQILKNNLLININMLNSARINKVEHYFFSSSACVYPEFLQEETEITPLKEEDAIPAQPQDGYGWEKLITEKMCQYYRKEHGLKTTVARFHNAYGPYGTWDGGREKAPAALCRKIAEAKLFNSKKLEIWGDGEQTRSFCYVGDTVRGIVKLVESDYPEPLNIGSDRLVTINQLADIIMDIAEVKLEKVHIEGPQGVRGRNSDNTKVGKILDWKPEVSLEEGLAITYKWIEKEVEKKWFLTEHV